MAENDIDLYADDIDQDFAQVRTISIIVFMFCVHYLHKVRIPLSPGIDHITWDILSFIILYFAMCFFVVNDRNASGTPYFDSFTEHQSKM